MIAQSHRPRRLAFVCVDAPDTRCSRRFLSRDAYLSARKLDARWSMQCPLRVRNVDLIAMRTACAWLAQESGSATVGSVLVKLGCLPGGVRMNLRTFSAISAVSMLLLGGCVIVGGTPSGGGNGGGGNGGEGNTGNTTNTGGKGGSAGAGVGGAGGGAGGAPACAKTCADAVTDGTPVCESSPASVALYDALAKCSCEQAAADPTPGCKDVCADNLCAGMDFTADCGKCVQTGACTMEFGACSSDF